MGGALESTCFLSHPALICASRMVEAPEEVHSVPRRPRLMLSGGLFSSLTLHSLDLVVCLRHLRKSTRCRGDHGSCSREHLFSSPTFHLFELTAWWRHLRKFPRC
ncbi:hypothetical protein KC19_VG105100 [Ceratodon purpureus]|uniref:Uncharacterized protein n=1 Tax=Ceratodon purpureus TaxID=3225 RepID=A0A8T0HPK7_CERPU|nr:hypothetical protein KC19_VG105100 [Ceratodon purpureus]